MNKLDEIVPEIDKALTAQEFPDYTPEITSIGLPPWMTKKSEEQPSQEEIELY